MIYLADDHVETDKAHCRRPTLPLNGAYNLIPIVYIQDGNYHIASCRPEVRDSVLLLGKIVQPYAAINWAAGVANCEVRAATNGGFFKRAVPQNAIGEYADGQWRTDCEPCTVERWCFGFTTDRRRFGVELMVPLNSKHSIKTLRVRPRQEQVYVVYPRIREAYGHGLANVGYLVREGQARSAEESDGWPDAATPRPRTAIAWAALGGVDHVWLVTTTSATWDGVAHFITNTLPFIMHQRFRVEFERRHLHAMMLDGGGSTQFAYRRKDWQGNVVERESTNAPRSDGRTIHNILGAKAPWQP